MGMWHMWFPQLVVGNQGCLVTFGSNVPFFKPFSSIYLNMHVMLSYAAVRWLLPTPWAETMAPGPQVVQECKTRVQDNRYL